MSKSVREILLKIVNDCEECAQMGERIMCQTAAKEEKRLKCIDFALSDLVKLIEGQLKIFNPNNEHSRGYGSGWNDCIQNLIKKIKE